MHEKLGKAEILSIPLNKDKAMPLYIQVERYLTDRILKGDFEEGSALPSPRLLAKQNGIAKNTILHAYGRMLNKGYLSTSPGKYHYICFPEKHRESIQKAVSKRLVLQARPQWRFELHQLWPKAMSLEGFRYGRRRPYIAKELDHPPPPQWIDNHAESSIWNFEVLLAKQMNKRYGTVIGAAQLCLFEGQQHIFYHLAYRILTGKMVLVVCPCDPSILAILHENEVIPMALNLETNGGNLDLRQVNTLCSMFPISAVILDRHFYHLTFGLLPQDTFNGLLHIATHHDILIMEHLADHDLWFGTGKYPFYATGKHSHLLQSFHLSTHLSPFCYFGLITGPESYINILKHSRQHNALLPDDGLADSAIEALLHGKHQHQRLRLHRQFAHLREAAEKSLQERLGKYITFTMPPSGLACWVKLHPCLAASQLETLLEESGIRLLSSHRHYLEPQANNAYLFAFGGLGVHEIDDAVASLEQVFTKLSSGLSA